MSLILQSRAPAPRAASRSSPNELAFAVVGPGEAELEELLSRLGAYNRERADWSRRTVAGTLSNADGALVGGG